MHSSFLRASVVLASFLSTSARPQSQLPGGSWGIGGVDDWVSSGNYEIYSCASEASKVKNILDRTYLTLQTAILSTDSSAYKAFFRSADPGSVTAVLNAITAGTNITTKTHGSRRPTLVCVNAINQEIHMFWKLCQDSENTVIIQPPGTQIVFLCPIFFNRELFPQSTECGVVNYAGTKMISYAYIAGSQYGFLTQALADMYILEIRGRTTMADVRDVNACLALPPDQALMNPSSYAYYVSSKWWPLHSVRSCQRETLMRILYPDIRAGCTQFPSRVPIQRDRELLAIDGVGDGNGTDILTGGCFGVGSNSTSCSP